MISYRDQMIRYSDSSLVCSRGNYCTFSVLIIIHDLL
jgi:hypothetical protein